MVRGLPEIALLLLLLITCASSSIDNILTDEDFSSLSFSYSFTFTDLDNTLSRSSSTKSNKLKTKSSKSSSDNSRRNISKSSKRSHVESKSKKVFQLSPLDGIKIINGRATSKTRYPYAVSLQTGAQQQRSSKHFCGGSLIATDVVLTAGHCSSFSLGTDGVSYHVVVGRPDLRYRNMGEDISVKREIRHPSYNNVTYDNDFALVFLSRKVQQETALSTYVKLNRDINAPVDNEGLTVMGWGDTEEDEDIVLTSNMLMETRVSAVNNSICEETRGVVKHSIRGNINTTMKGAITDNMLCASSKHSDACQGDSGGPLIRKGNDEFGSRDLLVGIVSWGLGCSQDFPGVYSRVSSQYGFIRKNVCLYSVAPPDWFKCSELKPSFGERGGR